MKQEILQKIKDRRIVTGVVGLGYVGLPLAVEKAKAGFRTIGFDLQKRKVDSVAICVPTPMSAQTAFAGMPRRECPAAARLCDAVLSLPISPYITKEQQQEVIHSVKEYVG